MALVTGRWDELQALFHELTPGEMERPLGDGWSAKVHLGHLAAWERSLMALLRGEDREAAMGLPADLASGHDTDDVNQLVARRTAALALSDVLRDSAHVHVELVALLESLSESDFLRPYSDYQPQVLPVEPRPVFAWVNGNTWAHYEEHIAWLRAGLEL